MAMNRIQFQAGLSMSAFFERYGTESLCTAALERARWPDGFRCPRCGGAAHCLLRDEMLDAIIRLIPLHTSHDP